MKRISAVLGLVFLGMFVLGAGVAHGEPAGSIVG
jgi:hypothetical protein